MLRPLFGTRRAEGQVAQLVADQQLGPLQVTQEAVALGLRCPHLNVDALARLAAHSVRDTESHSVSSER